MKTKKINHALGTFSFKYDESKPWTKEDDLMLNTYLEVMDTEMIFIEKAKQLIQRYKTYNNEIQYYQNTFRFISSLIVEVKEASDQILNDLTSHRTYDFQDWLQKLNDASEAIARTNDSMLKIADENQIIDDLFEELMTERKKNRSWSRFTKIKNKHHKNHERNSIDVLSFDQEEQKMYSSAILQVDWDKELYNYCNTTYQNYQTLMREIQTVYGLWAEHEKRIRLIKLMISENPFLPKINLN